VGAVAQYQVVDERDLVRHLPSSDRRLCADTVAFGTVVLRVGYNGWSATF
jgi:hypothetical protein